MSAGSKKRIEHWEIDKSAPAYLHDAMKDVGLQEWVMHLGKKRSNPVVERYIEKVSGRVLSAIDYPWCAFWVGAKLEYNGHPSTKSGMARSYVRYGEMIWDVNKHPPEQMQANTQEGDIVVMWRGRSDDGVKGHVGFLLGFDEEGNPVLVSGNDHDSVQLAVFPAYKVIAIVRPKSALKSKTLRSVAGSGISEATNQLVSTVVPEPTQQQAVAKALEAVQSIEGPVKAISTFKPWITAALSTITLALLLLAAWYRYSDHRNGRNN